MENRTFTDVAGVVWEVWEVYPRLTERRLLRERRTLRRGTSERRHVPVGRPTLPRQILGGWLAFQSKHERRRVLPVPDDWEDSSNRERHLLVALDESQVAPQIADLREFDNVAIRHTNWSHRVTS